MELKIIQAPGKAKESIDASYVLSHEYQRLRGKMNTEEKSIFEIIFKDERVLVTRRGHHFGPYLLKKISLIFGEDELFGYAHIRPRNFVKVELLENDEQKVRRGEQKEFFIYAELISFSPRYKKEITFTQVADGRIDIYDLGFIDKKSQRYFNQFKKILLEELYKYEDVCSHLDKKSFGL